MGESPEVDLQTAVERILAAWREATGRTDHVLHELEVRREMEKRVRRRLENKYRQPVKK